MVRDALSASCAAGNGSLPDASAARRRDPSAKPRSPSSRGASPPSGAIICTRWPANAALRRRAPSAGSSLQRRWPSASTAANAVAFSTGTLLQRRLCTSGPEISGPERAVGRQASGLPPSLTQKPSPAGDGSSLSMSQVFESGDLRPEDARRSGHARRIAGGEEYGRTRSVTRFGHKARVPVQVVLEAVGHHLGLRQQTR